MEQKSGGRELKLITCIVQRGKAEKVVDAALEAGAGGVTWFYGRGTGVRQKLGITGKFISPDKEILLIAITSDKVDNVFDAIVKVGRLEEKGQGFAFVHTIDKAVGF